MSNHGPMNCANCGHSESFHDPLAVVVDVCHYDVNYGGCSCTCFEESL